MDKEEHLARLRVRRSRMESIDQTLASIRAAEDALQDLRVALHDMQASERQARLKEVQAAANDGVAKTTISKVLGWNRATLYGALKAAGDK